MELKKYEKYKDSGVEWIGDIPVDWKSKRVKDILKEPVTDGPHETPVFTDEGVPFLSVDGIQDGELVFEGCRFISQENHEEYKKKCFPRKGDVLIGKAASTGKIAKVKVDFEFSVWSPLALLKTNPEKMDPSLFEYLMKSESMQYNIQLLCNINTQSNIGMKDIPKMRIALPPRHEQKLITEFLDEKIEKINRVIKNKKMQEKLLKEHERIIINKAVTRGLDKDVKLRDSKTEWLGNIPEEWEIKRLALMGDFSKGKGIKKDEVVSEGYPCIRYGEIYTHYNRFVDNVFSFIDEETAKNSIKVKSGSILFAGSGETIEDIGKAVVNLRKSELYAGGDVIIFHFNKNVNFSFISYLVNSNYFNNKKSLIGKGDIIVHIYSKKIKDIKFPLPKLSEQQKIADYLDEKTSKIRKSIEIIEKEVEKLEEFKKILINNAVTGKIKAY